jgi:hypothetical protein
MKRWSNGVWPPNGWWVGRVSVHWCRTFPEARKLGHVTHVSMNKSITHMAFFRFRHPSSSHILGLVIDLFHPYTSLSARPSLPSALRPTMGTGRWTNWKGKVKHVNLLDKICNQSTSLQCIWGIFMMILKLFPSYSSRCLSGEELLGCTAGSHSVSASSRMVLESLDKICIYTFMLYVSS